MAIIIMVGIVFGREPSPVFELDLRKVVGVFAPIGFGIFELILQGHGVSDCKSLVHRHPETTLVVSSWAVVVLPKKHGGTVHQFGFGIVVSFDGGSLLRTRQAHGGGTEWDLLHEVEAFAGLDIVNMGVDP